MIKYGSFLLFFFILKKDKKNCFSWKYIAFPGTIRSISHEKKFTRVPNVGKLFICLYSTHFLRRKKVYTATVHFYNPPLCPHKKNVENYDKIITMSLYTPSGDGLPHLQKLAYLRKTNGKGVKGETFEWKKYFSANEIREWKAMQII